MFHAGYVTLVKTICIFLVLGMNFLPGAVIRVSPEGPDSGDGSSWDQSCPSLQKALDKAVPGDQIWIRKGIYHPEKSYPFPSAEYASRSFHLREGISMLGGFAGTETSPEQRERKDLDGNGLTEAWEYSSETILEGSPDSAGSVVISGLEPLTRPVLLEGLTIRGGNPSGQHTVSQGGGAWLNGSITLQNSRILDNQARRGAGLFLGSGTRILRCQISGNRLLNDCWNSCGGGIFIDGDQNLVACCLITDNGTALLGGGGIYCRGASEITRCVLAGNSSSRYGSAIRFEDAPARLGNSLFWKNTPEQIQIYPGGAQIHHNACTQYLPGNLCIQQENAGPEGIEISASSPDIYYACLVDPDRGNYSLGRGSALINRGSPSDSPDAPAMDCLLQSPVQQGHPDIGCYESPHPGNLILDFYLTRPVYYGSTAALCPVMPEDQKAICSFVTGNTPSRQRLRGTGQEIIRGTAPGQHSISGGLQLNQQESTSWNPLNVEKSYSIARRKLVLQGDSLVWETGPFPPLTWKLIQGELLQGDTIAGAPELLDDAAEPGIHAFGQGSLAVHPVSSRDNYELEFRPGSIDCRPGGTPEITFSNTEQTYSGLPLSPAVSTLPPGLPVRLSFRNKAEGVQEETDQPPVNAGSYEVTARVEEGYCRGNAGTEFTIRPAELTCTADSMEKFYGDPMPEFTITYRGFQGNDTAADIIPPAVRTDAAADSLPRDGGYELRPEGGQAANYRLIHVPGTLTVSRIIPKINESLAGICTYGTPMKHILLMAFATDSITGEFVPGEFVWDNPEKVSPAGDWEYSWTFLPDDDLRYEQVRGITQVYVARRKISVSAFPQSKIYGDQDPRLKYEITAGSLARGDSFAQLLIRIPGEQPGDYSILLNNSGQYPDYEITYLQNFLTIRKRSVTVRAEDKSIFYNEDEPELTYVITKGSLAFNDQFSGELRRSPGSLPGTYPITRGSLNLPEAYSLQFIAGTFLIRSPELYAEGELPEFSLRYGQLLQEARLAFPVKRNDTGATVKGILAWDAPETALLPGEYQQSWHFLPEDSDVLQPLTGTCAVTVDKAPLQIRFPETYSREYLAPDPMFSYEITGYQFDDNETLLEQLPEITGTAAPDSPPGRYKIQTRGGQDHRYVFIHNQTSLDILPGKPRADSPSGTPVLIITHRDSGRREARLTYGEPLGKLQIQSTFYNQALPPEKISGQLRWVHSDAVLHAGRSSQPWIFQPDSPCYQNVSGTWEIQVDPAPLKISVRDCEIEIDMPLPEIQPVYEGFVNQENSQSLVRQPVAVCDAADSSRAGVFRIAFKDAFSPDYAPRYQEGKLTISAIALQPEETLPAFRFAYGTSPEEMNYRGHALRRRDGAGIPGTYIWQQSETVPDAGSHRMTWQFTADSSPEKYAPLSGTQTVIIEALPIRVLASPMGKVYGDPDPVLTYAVPEGRDLPEGFFSGCPARQPGEDAGSYTITRGSLQCPENYSIDFTPAQFTISPRTLQVSVSPLEKEYGTADPAFLYQSRDHSLQPEISGRITRSAGENAGTYQFSTEQLSCSGNYRIHLENQLFTIRPRNITLTAAGMVKAYGTPDPVLDWTVTEGSILPGDSPTGSLARIPGEEPGGYAVTRGSLRLSGNYLVNYHPGELTITPAPLKVSRPQPALQARYGQSLTGAMLDFQVLHQITGEPVPGKIVWEHPEEKLLPGTGRHTWKFLPEKPACYSPLGGETEIQTGKALLTVSLKESYSRGYMEQNPSFNYLLKGFVFNESQDSLRELPVIQCTADAQSPPGTYPVRSTGGLDDRYEFIQAESSLTITAGRLQPPADDTEPPLRITHAVTGSDKAELVYGTPLSSLRLEGHFYNLAEPPSRVSGKAAWLQPDQILPAGTVRRQWIFTPDSASYSPFSGETEILVRPAPLRIAVENCSMEADDPLPEISPAYSGFVNQEDSSVLERKPVLRTAGTNPGVPGSYSLVFADAEARNYSLEYRPGTLTVRPIQLTADSHFPELETAYGSTFRDLNWRGSATCKNNSRKIPGTYAWDSPDRMPAPGSTRYSWQFIPDRNPEKYLPLRGSHSLRVTPRTVFVKADDLNQIYGDPVQKLTFTCSGEENLPPDFLSGSLVREPGTDAGTYAITRGSLQCPAGYELSFTPGTYVIQPRPVHIRILPESKLYGDPDPEFQYLTDDPACQEQISGAIRRQPGENPGPYTFSAEALQASRNHRLLLDTRVFTVRPRPVTITADSQEKFYGTADPRLSWKISSGSLLPQDRIQGSLTRGGSEQPGSHSISRGSLSLPAYYDLTFVPGTLTILPAPVRLTPRPEPLECTYGDLLTEALLDFKVRHISTETEIPGTLTWAEPGIRLEPGEKLHRWQFIPEDDRLYQPGEGEILIRTRQAPLTCSLQKPSYSRPYLTSNPQFAIQYEGLQFGETPEDLEQLPEIRCEASRISQPGSYPVVLAGGHDPRYEFILRNSELLIRPDKIPENPENKVVLIHAETEALDQTLCYGEPLSRLQLAGTFYTEENPPRLIPGRVVWTEPDQILTPGPHQPQWQFLPDEDCYLPHTGTASVTVRPAPLTISVPDYHIHIGEPLPECTPRYSGFVNNDTPAVLEGQPEIFIRTGDSSQPGEYPIEILNARSSRYVIQCRPGTLHISRYELVLASPLKTIEMTYSQSMKDFRPYYSVREKSSETIVYGKFEWDDPDLVPPVGNQEIRGKFIPTDGTKYAVLPLKIPVKVKKYTLEIHVFNSVCEYGDKEQPLKYGLSPDTILPPQIPLTGKLEREPGLDAGTYAITQGSLRSNSNVDIIFYGAFYAIHKRALKINPVQTDKTYGDPDPELSFTAATQLFYNDRITQPLKRKAGENIGNYELEFSHLDLNRNYKISFVNRNYFTISPRPITVAFDQLKKNYGDPDPELTWTLRENDFLADAGIQITPRREAGEDCGKYTVSPLNSSCSKNFRMTVEYGQLLIQPRPVRLDVFPASKNLSDPDPVWQWTLAFGEKQPDHPITGVLRRQPGENPGKYLFLPHTLNMGPNHVPEFTGSFTINPQIVHIQIDNCSKYKGSPDPVFTWSITTPGVTRQMFQGDISIQREPGELQGYYQLTGSKIHCHPHYEPVIHHGKLLIKDPGITFHDVVSTEIHYGEQLEKSRLSGRIIYSDGQIEQTGTFSWEYPKVMLRPGTYTTRWNCAVDQFPDKQYSGLTTVTVLPKKITVRGGPVYKLHQDPDPELTYHVDVKEFVNMTPKISGTLTRTPGENPGEYRILRGSLSFGPEYEIDYQEGSFFICSQEVTVNPIWEGQHGSLEQFQWEGRNLIYQKNAFATLTEAVRCCYPGGTVSLCPGYYQEAEPLIINRSVLLHGQHPSECVLLTPLQAGGPSCTKLSIRNLVIAPPAGEISALTLLSGCSDISLNQVTLRGGRQNALTVRGASRLTADSCTFATDGGIGLEILAGDRPGQNQDVEIRDCAFKTAGPGQSFIRLEDDRLNDRYSNGLPVIGCTFNGRKISLESPAADLQEVQKQILDGNSPNPPSKARVFLKERRILCDFEDLSPESEPCHTMFLKNIPVELGEHRFRVLVLNWADKIISDRTLTTSQPQIGHSVALSGFPGGKYRYEVTQLSPAPAKDCLHHIDYAHDYFLREEMPTIYSLSIVPDQKISSGLPVDSSFSYQVFGHNGNNTYNITDLASVTYDPEKFIPMESDDGHPRLYSAVAGTHELKAVYGSRTTTLGVTFLADETVWYHDPAPVDTLEMGEYHSYDYKFYDKFGNLTEEKIASIECSDTEYLHPNKNMLLVDIDVPFTEISLVLVSNRGTRIPLTQKIRSPGNDWILDRSMTFWIGERGKYCKVGLRLKSPVNNYTTTSREYFRPNYAPGKYQETYYTFDDGFRIRITPQDVLDNDSQSIYIYESTRTDGNPRGREAILVNHLDILYDKYRVPLLEYVVLNNRKIHLFQEDPLHLIINATGRRYRWYFIRESKLLKYQKELFAQ